MFRNWPIFLLALRLVAQETAASDCPTRIAPPLPPPPMVEVSDPETPRKPPFVLMMPVRSDAVWDIHMSPYAGGQDILFATRIFEKGEIYFLSKSPLLYSSQAYARAWRLSELISVWLPINYLGMVVQHEVFGHGYRVRDLEGHNLAKVSGYSFNAPPPYGPGGAATGYYISEEVTTSELTAVASGGVEATAILAEEIKLKWMESGFLDPRQAFLYFFSEQDLTLYIATLSIKQENEGKKSHDIHGYLSNLNYTYPDNLLSKGRLRSLSWINFADPCTYYSIYALFRYIAWGRETSIPMIASCYLPNLRLGLTPFGPQVFFENYFLRGKIPIYAYIAGGHHAKNNYYSLGAYAPRLWPVGRWAFGLRGDIWWQPKLLLSQGSTPYSDINFDVKPSVDDPLYSYEERHATRLGAALSAIVTMKSNGKSGIEIEAGYKSIGYLPGYSLWASPTVRLAYTLVF
jgi:hypothetical protein